METELGRDQNYIDGMEMLFRKYSLTGWEQPMATLRAQLADYDAWLRSAVLPKARHDFKLPPQEYSLALENYGIDIPPGQLTQMAHQQFAEIQMQMDFTCRSGREAAWMELVRIIAMSFAS